MAALESCLSGNNSWAGYNTVDPDSCCNVPGHIVLKTPNRAKKLDGYLGLSAFQIVSVSDCPHLGSSASRIISISDHQHLKSSVSRIISTPDCQHPGCPTQARRSKGIVCYPECATWNVSLPGHQCPESPASRIVRVSDCLRLKSSAFWIVNISDVLRYRCGPVRTQDPIFRSLIPESLSSVEHFPDTYTDNAEAAGKG